VRVGIQHAGSPPDELSDGSVDIECQFGERSAIGIRADSDHDIRCHVDGKQSDPGQLTEPALELVSRHGGMSEARDDQSHARAGPWRTHERGSDGPNLQMRGSETLPLLRDTLQFRASRYACTPRKTR
jgi:hypothetical protein